LSLCSEAFQAEKRRIQEEANRKRSEAAREQHEVSNPRVGEKSGSRTECPTTKTEPAKQAKAAASKTNPGAVARGDKLAKERPDLADQVRKGEIKPAEAHRQMRRDEVVQKATELPDGKYVVIYADPPWSYHWGHVGWWRCWVCCPCHWHSHWRWLRAACLSVFIS